MTRVLVVLAIAAVAGCSSGGDGEPDVRDIEITMAGDQFVPAEIEVEPNSVANLTITNTDTVAHEIVVGGPKTHERISTGEAGEDHGGTVIPPGETRSFQYTFGPEGSTLTFACHLDGHYDDGMRGTFTVVATAN